jgi:hypothetical protein
MKAKPNVSKKVKLKLRCAGGRNGIIFAVGRVL